MKRVTVPRDVVGETISCRNHSTVGDCQDYLPIGIIGVHIPWIAREARSVLDLLPIDRVAARNYRSTIDNKNPTPVMVVLVIAWPIGCKPVCPFQRPPEHMQNRMIRANYCAFSHRVACNHAMKQLAWNMRAAVEGYQ